MDTTAVLKSSTGATLHRADYTAEELAALHRRMGLAALRRRRIRTGVLIVLNVIMALFILFPLLRPEY